MRNFQGLPTGSKHEKDRGHEKTIGFSAFKAVWLLTMPPQRLQRQYQTQLHKIRFESNVEYSCTRGDKTTKRTADIAQNEVGRTCICAGPP